VSDQTTLAACPFCGETHALTVDNLAGDDWYVECGACKVQQHAIYPTFGAAAAAWNRRASSNGDVSAYIASLVAERDALAEDAERYRWLRDKCGDSSIGVFQHAWDSHYRTWLSGASLDAAIDAARKALK
jgi:hypothetical protein